jgi:hypothetical protein
MTSPPQVPPGVDGAEWPALEAGAEVVAIARDGAHREEVRNDLGVVHRVDCPRCRGHCAQAFGAAGPVRGCVMGRLRRTVARATVRPRLAQSSTRIYRVTDFLHEGRTVHVTGDQIVATISAWLADLEAHSPLVEDLAAAVRIGNWPVVHNLADYLSVEVGVAAVVDTAGDGARPPIVVSDVPRGHTAIGRLRRNRVEGPREFAVLGGRGPGRMTCRRAAIDRAGSGGGRGQLGQTS